MVTAAELARRTPVPPAGNATGLEELFFDRDWSLLAFQRRILEEARDEGTPLLERVRFLGILGSNLDEFSMVREAHLARALSALAGQGAEAEAAEHLDQIRTARETLMREARRCFDADVLPALETAGLHITSHGDLLASEHEELSRFFSASVLPLLMPLGISDDRRFPLIANRGTTLAVITRDRHEVEHFACVRIPSGVPSLVPFDWRRPGRPDSEPSDRGFVWIDELVAAGLPAVFPGATVIGAYPFRVIRDAEVEPRQTSAEHLPQAIQEGVQRRQFGDVVALAVDDRMPPRLVAILARHLRVEPAAVHRSQALRDLSGLVDLPRIERPELYFQAFHPRSPQGLPGGANPFETIANGDVLVHHPFDSFEPIVNLFDQAARDPDVLAISVTLYRIDRHARIVRALLDARKRGKAVRVVVELLARFDEENNVAAARALESAGAHVVYGPPGMKVHAKLALFVRREGERLRQYVHISSGNYNADTATAYTDLGLLTADEAIGHEVSAVFNLLTGDGQPPVCRTLLVSPAGLRSEIVRLIHDEIDCHRREGAGHIVLKANALEDSEIILELYRASQAGVTVDLIVRGICCLRPGLPGISDHIRVRSIVGRLLEHSRAWYFHNGGRERVYIGSADLMTRNLDRRLEVMVPIRDERLIRRVRDEILGTYLADNVKARQLTSNGRDLRAPRGAREGMSSQELLLNNGSPAARFHAWLPHVPVLAPRSVSTHLAEPARGIAWSSPGLLERSRPTVSPKVAVMTDKKLRRRRKTRSVWISFTGRILAQIVGAVATIVLGVHAVDRYGEARHRAEVASAASPSAQTALAQSARTPNGDATLAVLPLQNFSGDPRQDSLADSLTEALIAALAQEKGVRVTSRTSSMAYRSQPKMLPAIAQELAVDWIIEGSIVTEEGRVRVTAQLIEAKDDDHVWARTYEHTTRDVLALQASVASAVAAEVSGLVTTTHARLMEHADADAAAGEHDSREGQPSNLRGAAGFQDAVRFTIPGGLNEE